MIYRFPHNVEALAELPTRCCIIDGEAIACGENGLALFDRLRHRRHDARVFLYVFDLIKLDGEDLQRGFSLCQGHACKRACSGGGGPALVELDQAAPVRQIAQSLKRTDENRPRSFCVISATNWIYLNSAMVRD